MAALPLTSRLSPCPGSALLLTPPVSSRALRVGVVVAAASCVVGAAVVCRGCGRSQRDVSVTMCDVDTPPEVAGEYTT